MYDPEKIEKIGKEGGFIKTPGYGDGYQNKLVDKIKELLSWRSEILYYPPGKCDYTFGGHLKAVLYRGDDGLLGFEVATHLKSILRTKKVLTDVNGFKIVCEDVINPYQFPVELVKSLKWGESRSWYLNTELEDAALFQNDEYLVLITDKTDPERAVNIFIYRKR